MLTTSIAAEPQVARTRYRIVGDRRDGVGGIIVGGEQKVIDFLGVETGEAEIEVRLGEFLQLESEELIVPRRPCREPIHKQTKALNLRFGPLVAKNHRN